MGADSVVEGLVNPDGGMSAVETLPGRGNTQPAVTSCRHV